MIGNIIGFGPDDSEDEEQAPVPLSQAVGSLIEQLGMRKGAMYDYCILRGIEIAVPDDSMRSLFLETNQRVPGLQCETIKYPGQCYEDVVVKYLGHPIVEARIESIIYDDRVTVKMLWFKQVDHHGTLQERPHIY